MSKRINPTLFENIPTFPNGGKGKDALVHGIIETAQGSAHKNALNAKYGIIALHEVLPEGMHWPYDYGFIPQTLGDDGDPLDLLFLIEQPTFSGCLVQARVLGSIKLRKNGVENDRLITAPTPMPGRTQNTDAFSKIGDVPKEKIDSICRFLLDYSRQEGNTVDLVGIADAKEAMRSITTGVKKFKKTKG